MQPTGEGPAPPPEDTSTARDAWMSGDSSTVAPPTASPNMPGAEHAPGAAPQVSEQQQQPQTVPVPVTPLKRGGILGVFDNIADALVGKTRPELGKDPDGNMYIKEHSLSSGEQWKRIAGEAIVGAAAGLKAGRGQGGGAAAAAGVQAGQQLEDREKKNFQDQISDEDKITMANANRQMLRMNLAQETWRASRLKVEATQHDIEFSQKQEDRLIKEDGGTRLGTVDHPGDISRVLKINPDLAADLVKNHLIELVPRINENGERQGFTVVKMPIGYRQQVLPAGTVFHTFEPISQQLVEHKASDPMLAGDRDDYDSQAQLAQMKYLSEKKEQDLKDANRQKALGDATKVPSEIEVNQTKSQLNRAEAGKVPSEIAKNDAAAAKERANSGEGPEGDALVDLIGTGRGDVGRLAYLASRNPALLEKVTKKYPDFDTSKVGAYVKTYQDFTSGKTSIALNAGSTALRHMQELKALNTVASHIPGTPAWNRYQNKVDTLSTELAKFYGDATIPAIKHIKDTLGANLPGNRDAAITEQSKSMGDKFDEYEAQWRRAAPSSAYLPLMPQLSEESKQARAGLDPKYKQRLVEEEKAKAAQPAPVKPPVIGQPQASSEPAIEQPLAPIRTHAFSKSAWLRANPNGDINAAVTAATAQQMPVID
jgi:hypothetical protein